MKILVFTVTSWNSKVGANTWSSLLEQYKGKDVQIANICIRDEIPDSDVCDSYFAISESKIIRSLFKTRIKTGRIIQRQTPEQNQDEYLSEHNERYRKMTKNRRYSMLLIRELIWKLGKWKTPELNNFLDDFAPDVILHAFEGYIHLNRIIEYAIKRTGAKVIGYIMDDNFTYKQSSKFGYKVLRFFQRRSLKRLAALTQKFFAISPMTKTEFDAFLGIDANVLTKPLNKTPMQKETISDFPLQILYTGNLLIGRDESLIKLINVLKDINKEKTYFILDVYTQTCLSDDKKKLCNCDFVKIHSAVAQSQILQMQKDADILLFLEDIDGKDAKTARLSFSTKITDYLSTGNAIFAIGNKDTSPMQYLADNKSALVCTNVNEIYSNLKSVIDNKNILLDISKNVCECAIKNHNADDINRIFDNALTQVLETS